MPLNGDILASQTQSDPTPQMPTATANSGSAIGSALTGALTGGIGNVVGAGLGLLLQGNQNQNQVNQQQKLTNIQTQAQEQLMQQQEATQMDMWQKTNYPAQVQELEQAGLNPALLYGKGGGGGTTIGGSMPSVTGATASNNMPAMAQMMAQQQQMGIQQAQIRNIDADTALKQTQTTKMGGVDTANVQAQTAQTTASTASIIQGITNQQTQNALMQAQTTATNINAENVQTNTKQIEDQIMILNNDVQVSQATIQAKINTIQQTAANSLISGELMQAGIKVDNEKVTQMANTILQGWKGLSLTEQQNKVQQTLMGAQTQQAGASTTLQQTETPLLKWQTLAAGINAIANLGGKIAGATQ